jgi:hypothetical protein
MHGPIRFALLGVCVIAACGESRDQAVATPASLAGADHPLLLLPDGPRAQVGRPFRLSFHGGGGIDGPVVTRLLDVFDPCMARVGGHQMNVLEPDVVGGQAGLTVKMPDDGNAMVGYSTKSRILQWRGERVRFSQHVKSLFIVARTARGVPVSSAAMSYRLGLRLEIVPMVDPVPLLPGDELPLQVRLDGPELDGAELVFHWRPRGDDAESREVFRGRTDDAGTVVVPIRKPGRYVATVVHREPGSSRPADSAPREVLWSALTFMIGEK